jgi:hypothetical protein
VREVGREEGQEVGKEGGGREEESPSSSISSLDR